MKYICVFTAALEKTDAYNEKDVATGVQMWLQQAGTRSRRLGKKENI